LQPARRCHGKAGNLGDDGAQAALALAQSFLKTGQDCLLVAALEINDAIGF
jgi:hypothetical protein